MTRTVAIETLGCKVNQYETSGIAERLEDAGFSLVPFREPADLYIVHGCAVTSRAAYQCRQLLRRARKTNPDAMIASVGCQARLESEKIAAEGLATHIIGVGAKYDPLSWLSSPGTFERPLTVLDREPGRALEAFPVTRMDRNRARAFLKVQDGCNAFCSYCVIPYLRGRSRGLPLAEVQRQLDRFVSAGYAEVVLTGIHLGQWGADHDPKQDLTDLLEALGRGTPPHRLRLSSIESVECTPRLLKHLRSWDWICPHFHVPLQSGDDTVLRAMGRPYLTSEYEEVILALRSGYPSASIGADVLVGFPGESEDSFLNTARLIERLPLTYLHVFPFSPRPGTRAANLPGRVTGPELRRRCKFLQDLGDRKREAFKQTFLGRWLEVIPESEIQPGLWQGTSENYLTVAFPLPHDNPCGVPRMVRVTEIRNGILMGMADFNPRGR